MTPSEALATTNPYALSRAKPGGGFGESAQPRPSLRAALRRLAPVMRGERRRLGVAFVSTLVASAAGLVAPVIIGRVVDIYIRNRDFGGVLRWAGLLLLAYIAGLIATYVQTF